MKVVLASASPRRARLLEQVGIRFEVMPSSIDEIIEDETKPDTVVETLARHKAEDVAVHQPERFIIAADTIVCLDNEILGKPADENQAKEFLRRLSGHTHDVFSGVYAGLTNSASEFTSFISFSERTKVTFSALSEQEINQYVQFGQPFDKAGSYGIQDDLGSLFVERIDGDYYNVVGFPLHRFYVNLRNKMPDIHKELFFAPDES
ncbi:Maf family protein [Rhodohalobacter sp. 614A]|uniref:Maf family protein n=1 Tax=Rhodohalobacter sp. 614A TaxID=2908649 RepID=UPI001F2AF93F|nr:Maf family protein [Rhodohalobacter sp. 614A]